MNKNRAIFLDRDGVINRDKRYVYRWQDFEFCGGAITAMRRLAESGYLLIIVTNQSGIGRGFYEEEDFEKLTQDMLEHLRMHKVHMDAVYHCPHSPEACCDCRKPAPGLILRAAEKYSIDLSQSVIVGDKPSDLEAGQRAGVGYGILIDEGVQPKRAGAGAHGLAPSLLAATDLILSRSLGSHENQP